MLLLPTALASQCVVPQGVRNTWRAWALTPRATPPRRKETCRNRSYVDQESAWHMRQWRRCSRREEWLRHGLPPLLHICSLYSLQVCLSHALSRAGSTHQRPRGCASYRHNPKEEGGGGGTSQRARGAHVKSSRRCLENKSMFFFFKCVFFSLHF